MRLIDADALKQKTVRLARHNLHFPGVKFDNIFVDAVTIDEIDEMPTIEERTELIREKAEGYWNYHRFSGMCFCSACGKHALYDTDCHVITSAFCPHCGVKMTTVKYGRDK